MNTDYEGEQFEVDVEATPEWEVENQKWNKAQSELDSELIALGLTNVVVMSSMNGEGFDCFLDVTNDEREAVYAAFAKAIGIEADEDDIESEVDKWLGNRLDNLFDWE